MDPLAFLGAGGDWCIGVEGDVHLLDLPNVSGLSLCGREIAVHNGKPAISPQDGSVTLDRAIYMADLCCTHCEAIYRRRRFHHPSMF